MPFNAEVAIAVSVVGLVFAVAVAVFTIRSFQRAEAARVAEVERVEEAQVVELERVELEQVEAERVETARVAEEKRLAHLAALAAVEQKQWDIVATLPPSVLTKLPPFANSIGMSVKLFPGDPDGAFSIGVHEVTQSQYEAAMGSDPSSFKGANSPVDRPAAICSLHQVERETSCSVGTVAGWCRWS